MSKETVLILGRAILQNVIATLRFVRCPACWNDQPFTAGREIPDCESCGYVFRTTPPTVYTE